MPERPCPVYTIVMDLDGDTQSRVHGLAVYSPRTKAMGEDEAAIQGFRCIVKRAVPNEVYQIRLVKDLETPDEKCLAKARRRLESGSRIGRIFHRCSLQDHNL